MTKQLLLLRHAKSSWKDPQLDDHDRPLNSRGREAAARMGRLMQDERIQPDLVLCSTARRAQETADLALAQFVAPPQITYRDDLYHASPSLIAQVLSKTPDHTQSVMIIGHNPGMEEFLTQVTCEVHSLPTAALAWVEFDVIAWSQFHESDRGRLVKMWRPRKLDSN